MIKIITFLNKACPKRAYSRNRAADPVNIQMKSICISGFRTRLATISMPLRKKKPYQFLSLKYIQMKEKMYNKKVSSVIIS